MCATHATHLILDLITILVFGRKHKLWNSSLCNFQLLFGTNFLFTGLHYTVSRSTETRKIKPVKTMHSIIHVHGSSPATRRCKIRTITKRGTKCLSRNHEMQRMPCCALVPSSRKQLYNIHEGEQHLEVTIWTHRPPRQAPLYA